jgi:hypothetical protein
MLRRRYPSGAQRLASVLSASEALPVAGALEKSCAPSLTELKFIDKAGEDIVRLCRGGWFAIAGSILEAVLNRVVRRLRRPEIQDGPHVKKSSDLPPE